MGPSGTGIPRDALEGKGPRRRPQRRLDRRLDEVAKAVGGGYCRLQMPLKPALCVSGIVAGHRLGALEGGGDPLTQGGAPPPPLPMHRWVYPCGPGRPVLCGRRQMQPCPRAAQGGGG